MIRIGPVQRAFPHGPIVEARTDRHCFRRVEALDPMVMELREWSRMVALAQRRIGVMT